MTAKAKKALQDIRLLVIDDDEGIRKLLTAQLVKEGAEVQSAQDGRQALQVLLENDFDVALVDIKMDRMDGFAFLLEARRIRPWLAMLIVTGYVDESTVARSKELGIESVIAKPIDLKVLIPRIKEEAKEKQERLAMPAAFSMDRFRYELEMLRKLGKTAIESDDLSAALRSLAIGLGEIISSTAVAILSMEDEPLLSLHLHQSVSDKYLAALENNLRLRYRALSGKDMPDEIRVEIEGEPRSEESPSDVGVCHVIPVIQGGTIHGLLLFSSEDTEPREEREIAFLYHAANHLATILTAFRRMKSLTIHDPPTGLFNQQFLVKQMDYLCEICRSSDLPLSLTAIDIRDFTSVNEQHGHTTGNAVLAELAQRLRDVSPSSATLGRYENAEILIAMPGTSRKAVAEIVENIKDEVAWPVFCKGTLNLALSLAIGTVTCSKKDLASTFSEELVARAQTAVALAKREEATASAVWSPNMSP